VTGPGWPASSLRSVAATARWPGCGRAAWTASAYGSAEPPTATWLSAAITVLARSSTDRS
jgi:hypothetical protein